MKTTTMTYLLFFIAIALVAIPTASAGTLISGSQLEVRSNYAGLDCGETGCVLGTWRNTPAVNDVLLVNDLIIPEPYEALDQAQVTFKQPTYENVFEVRNQKRLTKAAYSRQTFSYGNFFGGESSAEKCSAEFNDYRSEVQNNRALYPGFTPIKLRQGIWSCEVVWVTELQQEGWYGSVTEDQIFFEQDIAVDGVNKFRLARTQTPSGVEDDLVDVIPNLGRMALTNFGDYSRAELSDSNVWAYHGRNTQNTDEWKAFDQVSVITTYEALQADIANYDQTILDQVGWSDTQRLEDILSDLQATITQLNQAADNIRSEASSLPADWTSKGVSSTRTQSNQIIVEPPLSSITSDIQFILTGSSIGLYIPTGECTIRNLDSSVRWLEGDGAQLSYSVENTGSDDSTMVVSADCGTSQINTVSNDLFVAEGRTSSGSLRMTGRATGEETEQSFACTFTCEEVNTEQTDTREFTAVLERKQLCTQGEERAPQLVAGQYVVDVVNADCEVIQRKMCDPETSEFVLEQGTWLCLEKDDPDPGSFDCSDGADNDGDGLIDLSDPGCSSPTDNSEEDGNVEGNFSVGVLITALVLGLIAGLVTLASTTGLSATGNKGLKALRWILVIAVFALVFFGVAFAARFVIDLFTFTAFG